MKISLLCENERCSYEGPGPYVMNIPVEAVMDVNNLAAAYCPHCSGQLVHEHAAANGPRAMDLAS